MADGTGVDYLFGDAGDDTLVYAAEDWFDGGADFDRLLVGGAGTAFSYSEAGTSPRFVGIELIDLGDSDPDAARRVAIDAADILEGGAVAVDLGGEMALQIDLFVIGDHVGAIRDTVDLTGFVRVDDVDPDQAGVQGAFAHTDPLTGTAHTYQLWFGGGRFLAVEDGLVIE